MSVLFPPQSSLFSSSLPSHLPVLVHVKPAPWCAVLAWARCFASRSVGLTSRVGEQRKKLIVVVNDKLMHNHQAELADAMSEAGVASPSITPHLSTPN